MGKRVLITGARGMLASDLIPCLKTAGMTLWLSDLIPGESAEQQIHRLDICDLNACEREARNFAPSVIINCAAYTNVDRAESEEDLAFRLNADGPAILAEVAHKVGAGLVHVSTDYVFGAALKPGDARQPFREEDEAVPCGVYGRSKWAGERRVREILPGAHLIVRTSWLHGIHGPNFVDTMLRLGGERDELRVVNDQVGSPTWSKWLAEVISELVQKDACGTFHASSHGDISWFEFAKEIFELAGLPVRVLPQTTSELGAPAPRPAYSTLDLKKLETMLGRKCPSWRQGLTAHIALRRK